MTAQEELNVPQAAQLAADLFGARRFEEAERLFASILRADSGNFHAAHKAGICLGEQGRNEEALAYFNDAGAIMGGEMIALSCNRARALGELGRTAEAIAAYDSILRAHPDHVLSIEGRGLMKLQSSKYIEAIADFDEVLRRQPGNERALFSRGFANLALGNYADGFRDYEHRLKDDILAPDAELWTGEQELAGKTILVVGDMGHGDCIMFMRYLPRLVALGARVVVAMSEAVRPLAADVPGIEVVSEDRSTWPGLDYWVRTMSLAAAFRTTVDTMPPPTPLIFDPIRLREWRDCIGYGPGLKVGLCWSGSLMSKYDAHRSVPLKLLAPLFDAPNVEFYSLQVDVRGGDSEIMRGLPMIDLAKYFKTFRDTAHAVKCLDLVLTVDTSVAHLAGTVGVQTWVMLTAFRTYWLWIEKQQTSPWYPSVRLFRQRRDGDWPEVIARIGNELRRLTAAIAA